MSTPKAISHPFQELKLKLLAQPLPKDLHTAKSNSGQWVSVSYSPVTEDGEVPLATLHSWKLEITPITGRNAAVTDVAVGGDMPRHKHGLTTEPQIKRVSESGYTVQGLKFHMPGWWRVMVCVKLTEGQECVPFDLLL